MSPTRDRASRREILDFGPPQHLTHDVGLDAASRRVGSVLSSSRSAGLIRHMTPALRSADRFVLSAAMRAMQALH